VERCQNDDGGFFLTPTNPVQNKAGMDAHNRPRSYASATANGVRLLLRLGGSAARVTSARRWLEQHVGAPGQAGDFPAERQFARDGSRFYSAWTEAHAFLLLGTTELQTSAGPRPWGQVFADALVREQQPDGSFVNTATDLREDDPLVATPMALSALALARRALTGDLGTAVRMER